MPLKNQNGKSMKKEERRLKSNTEERNQNPKRRCPADDGTSTSGRIKKEKEKENAEIYETFMHNILIEAPKNIIRRTMLSCLCAFLCLWTIKKKKWIDERIRWETQCRVRILIDSVTTFFVVLLLLFVWSIAVVSTTFNFFKCYFSLSAAHSMNRSLFFLFRISFNIHDCSFRAPIDDVQVVIGKRIAIHRTCGNKLLVFT